MRFNCSIALLAILLAIAFGAHCLHIRNYGQTALAQEAASPSEQEKLDSTYTSSALEELLSRPQKPFIYPDVPLQDVMDGISARFGITIVIDTKALADAAMATDVTVNVNLRNRFSMKTFLDLTLEPLGLTWVTRDGYLLITTRDALSEHLEIRVYNCSDLLEQVPREVLQQMKGFGGGGGEFGGGTPAVQRGGFFAVTAEDDLADIEPAAQPAADLVTDFDSLVTLIEATVEPDSWADVGGHGSIEPFHGGLLVINQHGVAHRKIEALLAMMRQAKELPGTMIREHDGIPKGQRTGNADESPTHRSG